MKAKINLSNQVGGDILIPPSKSYTHRYIIACCLTYYQTKKASFFYNPLICNDTNYTLFTLRNLGFEVRYEFEQDRIICDGFTRRLAPIVLMVGESASTLRFLIPLACFLYQEIIIKGEASLFKRGIEGYHSFFNLNNILTQDFDTLIYLVRKNDDFYLPLNVDVSMSSQYITGFLLVAPLLNQTISFELSKDVVSSGYLDITFDVISSSGIEFERIDNKITIYGNQHYELKPLKVEADYSQGTLLEALQYDFENIKITNLSETSFQPDVRGKEFLNQIYTSSNTIIDLEDNIDLGPVLMAFAAKHNTTTFKNIKRLKIKESNRIEEMIKIFQQLKIKYELSDNEIKVYQTTNLVSGETFDTNDHRITQSLILLLSTIGGTINDVDNLKKSYPNLIPDLISLKFSITLE